MNVSKFLMCILFFWSLLPPAVSQGTAPPTPSSQRLALVIGNGAYKEAPLKNPANDAQDMAKVLEESGFSVILKTDADRRTMDEAIQEFGKRLMSGGVGLFFYAGHGIQVAGANYLIPVEAKIESEADVRYNGVDAGYVLGKMEDAGNEVNIVILDACRDNPFGRSFRSGIRGLAKMDSPKGSLIAYATAPGALAADGAEGRNGVFTKHLLHYLSEPGLKVTDALDQVRVAVAEETNKQQVPWTASSLMGNFYFKPEPSADTPSPNPTASAATTEKPTSRQAAADREALFWESVKESPDAAGYELYLKKYPAGEFSELAQLKIEQLQGKSASVAGAKTVEAGKNKQREVSPEPTTDSVARQMMAPPSTPALAIPAENNGTDFVAGMEFVSVPGGCFQMGDNFGDGLPIEKPVHIVCVDDFWMGKFEVTQAQWQRVMGTNPASFKSGENPVENVSWNDAQEFILKLNQQTGKAYRLPTEAEWEFACRSGGKQEKYCGGDNLDALAWDKANSKKKTHPVGQKKANGLGLYDMSGNVWEWCEDWHEENYYAASPRQNPLGPSSGASRVFRGGGWDDGPWVARSASRNGNAQDVRKDNLGFRLVLPQVKG